MALRPDIAIRAATAADAPAVCELMRRSISELCVADHQNDPAMLERWLANKNPETFRSWIRPDNCLLVALDEGRMLAVGCLAQSGEITLNYVSPAARFSGVSDAMLAALERRATQQGHSRCTLASTKTAQRFSLARGYRQDGEATGQFGMASGYPMSKVLAAPGS
jgi:GNAT superfamily N-acetyltransferase